MMNTVTTTGPRGQEGKTPVAKLPLKQVTSVREMLVNDMAKGQLASVAAKHMNPDRMMRLMANAIRTTPKLGDCNPLSLLGAMMQCASLGLEPNTVLGHAYLIPFDKRGKNDKGKWAVIETNVQLIIGYQGFIALGWRSGMIESFDADVHYSDCPVWEYRKGINAVLDHVPGNRDGNPLHAYAICKIKGGGVVYVVLPWAEVMKIRDGSQGWQSAKKSAEEYNKPINSPWATHEYAMARKTAIRALAKFMPMSTDFADAYSVDGATKVDFAAYAIDHNQGLAIEDQGQDNEGAYIDQGAIDDEDTGEVGGPAVIGDQRGQQTTMEQEPERQTSSRRSRAPAATKKEEPKQQESLPMDRQEDPAPVEQRRQQEEAPRESRQQQKPAADGPKLIETADLPEFLQAAEDEMKMCIDDGENLERTLEMFEGRLQRILATDKDEHDALVDDMKAYAAKVGGGQ